MLAVRQEQIMDTEKGPRVMNSVFSSLCCMSLLLKDVFVDLGSLLACKALFVGFFYMAVHVSDRWCIKIPWAEHPAVTKSFLYPPRLSDCLQRAQSGLAAPFAPLLHSRCVLCPTCACVPGLMCCSAATATLPLAGALSKGLGRTVAGTHCKPHLFSWSVVLKSINWFHCCVN